MLRSASFAGLSILLVMMCGCGSTSEPATAEPDAGADADVGAVDTSTTDTGASETGSDDTGTSDTGTSDTGASDTGTSDAEPADTGPLETGAFDSGPLETGVLDTGATDSDVGDTGPLPGAVPPAKPTTEVPGGATKWFAIKRLHLGPIDRNTGKHDPLAWRQYGFNLDARTTSKDDSKAGTNTCTRRAGSGFYVLTDGTLGRDNNFGQHFMSVVNSLKYDAEESVNQRIAEGKMTLLLRLDNVGPADNAKVPGALYLAGNLGGFPKYDGSDKWPIDTASLDAAEPRAKFPGGYMAGGVWVSGALGAAAMPIPLFSLGSAVIVPMESAVVSFDVSSGGAGTIAGAADPVALGKAFTPPLEQWGICPGNTTYDQVISTATSSPDLVAGAPSLQDTTKECNAISIGLGFAATPVAAPTATVTTATSPSDCL